MGRGMSFLGEVERVSMMGEGEVDGMVGEV